MSVPGTEAAADVSALRVRHELTNTLLVYLRAVDDHDLDGVLSELQHAQVSFGGPALRGDQDLTQAYRAAFAAGGRTRHLLHEVQVDVDSPDSGRGGTGRAAYQRWSLDTDPPSLTALGSYRAHLVLDGDHPHLDELTVHRDWQATAPPSSA